MRRFLLVLIVVSVVMVAIGFQLVRMRRPAEPTDPQHIVIEIPPEHGYGGAGFGRQLDISPDGRKVIYVGFTPTGHRIYQITIGQSQSSVINGTEGAAEPTFSPDGRYVFFFADGNVKRAALDGSPVSVIGKANPPRGFAWLDADTLILGNVDGGLLRMSISSGERSLLGKEFPGPQLPHLAPTLLPGNKAVVFTAARGAIVNARIGVLSIETGQEHWLLDENAFAPRYVPTGHIVFTQGNQRRLMAARFDVEKLAFVETPRKMLENSLLGQGNSTDYSFSASGSLIYALRSQEDIDEFFAEWANVNIIPIHVQLNWFDQLKLH